METPCHLNDLLANKKNKKGPPAQPQQKFQPKVEKKNVYRSVFEMNPRKLPSFNNNNSEFNQFAIPGFIPEKKSEALTFIKTEDPFIMKREETLDADFGSNPGARGIMPVENIQNYDPISDFINFDNAFSSKNELNLTPLGVKDFGRGFEGQSAKYEPFTKFEPEASVKQELG